MECKDCKFYEPSIGGKLGWCKRFPPVFNSVNFQNTDHDLDSPMYSWQFPRIQFNNWCGEFQTSRGTEENE